MRLKYMNTLSVSGRRLIYTKIPAFKQKSKALPGKKTVQPG